MCSASQGLLLSTIVIIICDVRFLKLSRSSVQIFDMMDICGIISYTRLWIHTFYPVKICPEFHQIKASNFTLNNCLNQIHIGIASKPGASKISRILEPVRRGTDFLRLIFIEMKCLMFPIVMIDYLSIVYWRVARLTNAGHKAAAAVLTV